MKKASVLKFPQILILLFLVSFASFTGLFLTPALPAMDVHFPSHTSAWVMSSFLIGYSLGLLPFGPLANRFGRKKAITIGMIIAFLGTSWAYFSISFWALCLARFIQALGCGVGLKVGFTIVSDLHAQEAATKASATLSAAFGFMPGLATLIGGFLTRYFGWQSCFLFLAIYIILLWLLCQTLPETALELQTDALEIKKIARNYSRHFKDPFLTLHAFLAGLSTLALYIFATLAPFIGINQIGLSSDEYGLWAFVPSMGILCGALISRKIADRMRIQSNIFLGILIVFTTTLILFLCFAFSLVNSWSLFITGFFLYLGCNLIWSNAVAKGMSKAYDKSNASAVFQCINVGTGTVGVFIAQSIPIEASILYPAALSIICILMFIFLRIIPK